MKDCNSYFDFESLNRYVEFDKPLYAIIQKRKTARLLYMSPKQYIYRIAQGFGGLSYEDVAESSMVSKEKIDKYAQWMEEGKKAPIIYYTRDGSYQEGRHRALAAMKLGCTSIPVVELQNLSDKEVLRFASDKKDMSFEELDAYFKENGFDNGISMLGFGDLQRFVQYSMNENYNIRKLVRESLLEQEKIWYHGTPDVRELEKEGGFTNKTISVSYITDPEEDSRLQAEMDAARASGDEKRYFELLGEKGKLRKDYSFPKPIFFTDKLNVAKTYADPKRAFDYQGAVEKVVKAKINPGKTIKIVATGDGFRFLNLNKVKRAFVDAGISEEDIDMAIKQFNYYVSRPGIKTDTLAAIAHYFGFDTMDVVGVLDSYEGGSTQSTVRAVMDYSNIRIKKEAKLSEGLTTGVLSLSDAWYNDPGHDAIQRAAEAIKDFKPKKDGITNYLSTDDLSELYHFYRIWYNNSQYPFFSSDFFQEKISQVKKALRLFGYIH